MKIRKRSLSRLLLISLLGIAINLGGYALNLKALGTPLYMDAIGTVLVSAWVGALPGMFVGYFSIVISAAIESSQQYYSIISVLIALMVGYAASKGAFRKLSKTLLILPPMVLMDTVVGVFLNRIGFFDSSPVYLTDVSAQATQTELLVSEIISTIIIECADKLIALLVAYFVLKFSNDVLHREAYSYVEKDMLAASWSDPSAWKIKRSLRQSVALSLAATGLLLELVSLFFIYHYYRVDREKDYRLAATVITDEAAQLLSPIEVGAVAEGRENSSPFIRLKSMMSDEMTRFSQLRTVCVFREENGAKRVLLYLNRVDTQTGDTADSGIAAGELLPEAVNPKIVQVERRFSGDQSMGVVAYYSVTDVSKDCLYYCANLFSVMLGILLCIIAVFIVYADRHLVLHINRMTAAMSGFAYTNGEERLKSVEAIQALDIRGGNELEALYRSISKTVADYTANIEDANQKAEAINRIQTNIITTIADLIESRDAETGQHTRRTSAYVHAIAKELVREGKFTELLTDAYVEDMTIAASLHDIGKICISDTILNKPGRLTDEEFEKMKEHTSAGRKILQDISANLGETEYLKIAMDLAGYHHEWWDGTRGYPERLKGEEIPLSARIMAIADVFDALITVRPYKRAFTIEEAVEIIHKESGTHFQPEIVEAFDRVLPELLKISERYAEAA